VPLAQLTTKTSKPTPPTRLVEAVRILITDSHVLIAADSHSGPVTIFSERISQLNWSGSRNKESSIVTESGKMLVFVRDDNCGCGSKLRTWNPYNTLHSSKDPIE
jgi:hypothetical protein